MITAIVRYRLPSEIGRSECQPTTEDCAGFGGAGAYQEAVHLGCPRHAGAPGTDIESARRFYSGPWLDGIRARYGTDPEIEYFETLVILDNPGGVVTLPSDEVSDPFVSLPLPTF